MKIIFDFLILIIALFFFSAVGGFIKWILFKRDKNIKECILEADYSDAIIGAGIIALMYNILK